MQPYHTLKVELGASSEEIREAYLKAVRKHPPETDPDNFRRIQEAFDAIDTEDKRCQHELGIDSGPTDVLTTPYEAVAAFFAAEVDRTPPDPSTFYKFLRL